MIYYVISEGTLTGIGDAVREKEGTEEKIPVRQLARRISRLDTSGENIALTERTLSHLKNNATKVAAYGFYMNNGLTQVTLPEALTVENHAFYDCGMLQIVDLESCETIGQSAFSGCENLASVTVPNLKEIVRSAFSGCKKAFFYIRFEELPLIPSSAFKDCANLQAAICSSAAEIQADAFSGCSSLAEVEAPLAEVLGYNAFQNCSSLTTLVLPKVRTANVAVFYGCTALTYLDFTELQSLSTQTFYNCMALEALVLRNTEAMVTLQNSSVFVQSSIAAGTGYIYVPKALLETYKADSLWIAAVASTDQIRPLEDYTVDGTVTGELDPDKLAGSANAAVLGKAVLGKMILGKE